MILPTNNRVDVYQYLNAQMKYLPDKSVKKLLKTMIYSNKAVYLVKIQTEDQKMTPTIIKGQIQV